GRVRGRVRDPGLVRLHRPVRIRGTVGVGCAVGVRRTEAGGQVRVDPAGLPRVARLRGWDLAVPEDRLLTVRRPRHGIVAVAGMVVRRSGFHAPTVARSSDSFLRSRRPVSATATYA